MKKNEETNKTSDTEYRNAIPAIPTSIPVAEQETVIQFGRSDDYATVCTSDSTVKTKLNRFCKESPDCWILKEDGLFTTYRCSNKKLISFRKANVVRELSEEEKQARSERMRQVAAQRRNSVEEELD